MTGRETIRLWELKNNLSIAKRRTGWGRAGVKGVRRSWPLHNQGSGVPCLTFKSPCVRRRCLRRHHLGPYPKSALSSSEFTASTVAECGANVYDVGLYSATVEGRVCTAIRGRLDTPLSGNGWGQVEGVWGGCAGTWLRTGLLSVSRLF